MSARLWASSRVLLSAAFALTLSFVVVLLAGYYESPGLLPFQLLSIAGPTVLPLLILSGPGRLALLGWLLAACLLAVGWSYVIYIDTRPYEGGGASFALLAGWFTCFVAFAFAALVRAFCALFAARR